MIKTITAFTLISLPSILWVNSAWAGGVLEVSAASYQQDNVYDTDDATLEARLYYEFNWQPTEQSALLFKPRLGLDTGKLFADDATWHEKNRTRSKLAIEELTFTQYLDNFEVSIGKQVFSWGLGDMYNPSDRLNPIDTLDPLNNIKLGQWAASLSYLGASSNINLVFIPRRSASRLPQQNNRWFRNVDAIQTAAATQLGFTPEVNLSRQLDHHSTTSGIQITSGQWLPGWDVELSYLHSQDAVGVYLPELVGTQLDLVRVFPAFDEASVGLSTVVGDYALHGVTTYRKTADKQQNDDYFTFLLGGRRSFYLSDYDLPEVIYNIEEITLALEYVKEEISRHRDSSSNYVSSGFGRTLTNSLLMNLELKFTEDTLLEFGLIQNLDKEDRYVSIELSHQLNDDFKVSIGHDALSGTSDSLFGQWSTNDRFFLNTSYHF